MKYSLSIFISAGLPAVLGKNVYIGYYSDDISVHYVLHVRCGCDPGYSLLPE